jgi:hypothetical protein
MKSLIAPVLAFACLLAAGAAAAQNSQRSGEYIVHYNAIPTTTLKPEVARQYGVTRSASRALLNIAVQRQTEAPLPVAITARVTASASLLTGQRQGIPLREVRDGEAIYYLGEARVNHEERLDFEIEVLPEGSTEPIRIRFSQTFFTR